MDIELCPMCKKHPALIFTDRITTIIKDVTVECDETVYFCSTLGEEDEDAYFIPPEVMDENIKKARMAYEKIRGKK